MALIALLTDFGHEDWFVGTLKGVIAGLAPRARVIDLCHGIPPGDLRAGAFALMAACRHFPPGTIFVAVVDPGVGGPREAVVVEAGGRLFVAPDNGLLSWAAAGKRRIHALENPAFRLPLPGRTFHGRDIFAPAAAHLARGVKPKAFGPARSGLVELPWPRPRRNRGAAWEIVYIDRFGNAITNITERDLRASGGAAGGAPDLVRAAGKRIPIKEYYAEAGAGRPLALVGSCGLLEIALRSGHAARKLGLRVGDNVTLG